MLKKLMESLQQPGTQSLAKTFSRLGRIGFWVQIVMGAIPLLLMAYAFIFSRSPSGPRAGLAVVEYLTLASLLILIFTIVWFHRYTRLARLTVLRIRKRVRRHPRSFDQSGRDWWPVVLVCCCPCW